MRGVCLIESLCVVTDEKVKLGQNTSQYIIDVHFREVSPFGCMSKESLLYDISWEVGGGGGGRVIEDQRKMFS